MSRFALHPTIIAVIVSALCVQYGEAAATTCQTYGRISLVVLGKGKCRGTAQANCDATSIQKVRVDQVVSTHFTQTPCIDAQASAAATSVAKAIASVWADALVKVTCTGKGVVSRGCGFAIANGQALSLAWTEAIAIAVTGAQSGPETTAFCIADIRALVPALATAMASAQSQLCAAAKGPIAVQAFQNAAATSMARVIANAFAASTSRACGKSVSSKCSGEGGAAGPTSANTGGEIEGGVNVPPSVGSGSAIGSAGGSASAPFESQCQPYMLPCCQSQSYPCPCPGCVQGIDFVEYSQLPSGGFAKHIKHGQTHCLCPL